jgi:hypothetical protein
MELLLTDNPAFSNYRGILTPQLRDRSFLAGHLNRLFLARQTPLIAVGSRAF